MVKQTKAKAIESVSILFFFILHTMFFLHTFIIEMSLFFLPFSLTELDVFFCFVALAITMRVWQKKNLWENSHKIFACASNKVTSISNSERIKKNA